MSKLCSVFEKLFIKLLSLVTWIISYCRVLIELIRGIRMEYKTPITISELLENKEKFLGKFITVEGNYIHPSYIYIPEGLCLLNGDDKDFARQEEINIYCWRDDELQLVKKVSRDDFLKMKTKTFLYPVYILEDTYEKKKMVVSSKIPRKYNLGRGKIYYHGFLHDYPNLPLSE